MKHARVPFDESRDGTFLTPDGKRVEFRDGQIHADDGAWDFDIWLAAEGYHIRELRWRAARDDAAAQPPPRPRCARIRGRH